MNIIDLTQKWSPFSVSILLVLFAILVYSGYSVVHFGDIPVWVVSIVSLLFGSNTTYSVLSHTNSISNGNGNGNGNGTLPHP